MRARVRLASTPAERFAAQIRELRARIDHLPDDAVQAVLALLEQARRQVLGELAGVPADSFSAARLGDLTSQIQDVLDRFVERYGQAVDPAQTALFTAGEALAAAPLVHAGIMFHVPQISRRQLEVAQALQATLIRNLAADAVGEISQQLQLGLLRGDDVFTVAQRIAGSLDAPASFGDFATRAEAITRTELGRIQAIATQAGLAESQTFVPDLEKQWRHATRVSRYVRTGHLEADGQVRAVAAPFRVRPMTSGSRTTYEELMYPRDPAGSAENTVFCGCTSVPYRAAWAEVLAHQEAA